MPEEFEGLEVPDFRPQAKRDFSRVGFALFAMFLISQLGQIVLSFVLDSVWPTYAEDGRHPVRPARHRFYPSDVRDGRRILAKAAYGRQEKR